MKIRICPTLYHTYIHIYAYAYENTSTDEYIKQNNLKSNNVTENTSNSIRIHIYCQTIGQILKKQLKYGGFIQLEHHVQGWARMMKDDGTFFREVEADLWDAKARIEYMEQYGYRCSSVLYRSNHV